MHSILRGGVWAPVALLGLCGWLVGASPSARADIITGVGLPDGGTLTLTHGSPDKFVWTKPNNGGSLAQTVTDKRDTTGSPKDACKLQLTPDPNVSPLPAGVLVNVTGGGGTAGYNKQKDWIGVLEQSKGVDCGRVSSGQSITLELKGELSNYVVEGSAANSAYLQVNAKQNVVIKATFTQKGAVQATYRLYTGLSANGIVPNGTSIQVCNPGISDSSPDSNADCPPWNFDGIVWDKAVFATDSASGVWSVAGPQSSVFPLRRADGVLGCTSTNNFFSGNGAGGSTTGTRLGNVADNGEPAPACVVVPYALSLTCPLAIAGNCMNFQYDALNQGSHMAFTFHQEWPLEGYPDTTSVNDIPLTNVYFGDPATATAHPLDLCLDVVFERDPTTNAVTGIASGAQNLVDLSDMDGTQAACLTGRSVQQRSVDGQSKIFLIEDAYIQGDVIMQRGGL